MAFVQSLYQQDMTKRPLLAIIEDFQTPRWQDQWQMLAKAGYKNHDLDYDFLTALIVLYEGNKTIIDETITTYLDPSRDLNRLELPLRALLRAGACEIMFKPDIPPQVAISEYLILTEVFFGENERKLVNAVLDKIVHQKD